MEVTNDMIEAFGLGGTITPEEYDAVTTLCEQMAGDTITELETLVVVDDGIDSQKFVVEAGWRTDEGGRSMMRITVEIVS